MDMIHLNIKLEQFKNPSLFRKKITTSIIVLTLLEVCIFIFFFPLIDGNIHKIGLCFDFITLITIAFMFWIVQCSHLPSKSYYPLTVGLLFWVISAIADVMDEIIFQPIWIGIFIEDVFRALGMAITAFGILNTIHFVSDTYAQLKIHSLSDELTCLPNRRYFKQLVKQYRDIDFSVILIDLDNFKIINDTYGHNVGDSILKKYSYMLKDLMQDMVSPMRYGGEEFLIFIPSNDKEIIKKLAEDILNASRTIEIANGKCLTSSLGMGCKKSNETTANLLERVDQALYLAKSLGRDRAEWAK